MPQSARRVGQPVCQTVVFETNMTAFLPTPIQRQRCQHSKAPGPRHEQLPLCALPLNQDRRWQPALCQGPDAFPHQRCNGVATVISWFMLADSYGSPRRIPGSYDRPQPGEPGRTATSMFSSGSAWPFRNMPDCSAHQLVQRMADKICPQAKPNGGQRGIRKQAIQIACDLGCAFGMRRPDRRRHQLYAPCAPGPHALHDLTHIALRVDPNHRVWGCGHDSPLHIGNCLHQFWKIQQDVGEAHVVETTEW